MISEVSEHDGARAMASGPSSGTPRGESPRLVYVDSGELVAHARALFREYADALGFDLCFQGFEQELASLPGPYAPPDGRLVLALWDLRIAGCVALKRIGADACEMKRLYVRPGFRGRGIGRRLALRAIDDARVIGYRRMRLDTVPAMMAEAVALYRSLGFVEVPPYYENPIPGALYMELAL